MSVEGLSVGFALGGFVGSGKMVFVFPRFGNLNFLLCDSVVEGGGVVVVCLKDDLLVVVGTVVGSTVVCLIGKRLDLPSDGSLALTLPRNLLLGGAVVVASVAGLTGNLFLGKVG